MINTKKTVSTDTWNSSELPSEIRKVQEERTHDTGTGH